MRRFIGYTLAVVLLLLASTVDVAAAETVVDDQEVSALVACVSVAQLVATTNAKHYMTARQLALETLDGLGSDADDFTAIAPSHPRSSTHRAWGSNVLKCPGARGA